MQEVTSTTTHLDGLRINTGGAFRARPAFNLGMACYLFRDRIARWPLVPGALVASLAAFIVLGSLLPTMTAPVAICVIAMLAIQADCAKRETLLLGLRFDRWSPLTYSEAYDRRVIRRDPSAAISRQEST